MDFSIDPSLTTVAREAAAVGRAAADGTPFPEDGWLAHPDRELARELGRRGWIGLGWGAERSDPVVLRRFAIFEALLAVGAPLASVWMADRQIAPTLLGFGTAEQVERWLPDIRRGTAMWCVGLSEPGAGSDLASLATRAERDGDHWVVTGSKVWTSGAAQADWMYLVARTNPTARPHHGLSELVVPMDSAGVTVSPITDMTGDRHFCEVFLDGVRVPADHLVGRQDGSFAQVMRQLEHERGGIDRLLSHYRLWLDCRARVDVSDPLLRQEVARIESGYRIGRHLVLREVLGQAPRHFSALTKTWCTEFEQRVTALCGRILGPAAVAGAGSLSARAQRSLCYSPAYTIMGGTTEVLRNVVAERLLDLPR